MKRFWFFILLTLAYFISDAQKILLLKTGEQIKFKSYKGSKKEIRFKAEEKGTLLFSPQEIVGYCSVREEKIFGLIKCHPQFCFFAERVMTGAINAYECILGSPPRYAYYLEKGDDQVDISSTDLFTSWKREKGELLKAWVGDEPSAKSMVEAEDFKMSWENILSVVNEYNLSKLSLENNDLKNNSSVFFYLKDKRKYKTQLKITIDEKTECQLSTVNFVSLRLPFNDLSKVCVGSHCEVLKSSPCFIKYIEILVTDEIGIQFRQVKSKTAQASVYWQTKFEIAKKSN